MSSEEEETYQTEELYSFMMDELNIDQGTVEQMKREKITCDRIVLMDEDTLSRFIPTLGDRIAIMDFAKRKASGNKRKKGLVAKLREIYGMKDIASKNVERKQLEGKKGKKYNMKNPERRIEIGWLHLKSDNYVQIRSAQGGGTRQISIKRNATKSELIQRGKSLFFPKGKSQYGNISEMECDLYDFQRAPFEDDMEVNEMFKTTGFSRLRFYLATRKRVDAASATITSGAYEDCLVNQSKSMNAITVHEDNSKEQSELSKEKKHSLYVLTSSDEEASAEACELREVGTSDTTDPLATLVGQMFPDTASGLEISHTAGGDVFSTEDLAFSNFGTENANSSDLLTYTLQFPVSSLPAEDPQLEHPVTIKLHRGHVMEELLAFFSDGKHMHAKLKVQMLLPNGIEEAAEDGGGVFRDSLSELWHEFYESCTLGTKAKVPYIRHDYDAAKWKSVARCLLKGWTDEKYFPIKLALPFIEHCFFGSTNCDMIEWFFLYVSQTEAEVLKCAIANFDNADLEELLEVLSNFECKKQPTKENISQLIRDISHKELIQKPMYVINAWREVLINRNISEVELKEIYEKLKPTAKNILSKITCTAETPEDLRVFGFLKKFIREADDSILARFLRFCTGADLVTDNRMIILFNNQQGFCRAPCAHTCSGILELSNTYDSYPEFRNEFKSVLVSNIWVMDAV